MLVPRMDSTARNAILNPAVGLLVYDSTTTTFWYYDELRWNEIRNGSQTVGIQDLVENYSAEDCLEEKASLNIMPSTNDIALDSNFAYIIGGGSLKVIDITNPSQLVESGSIATTSSARYIDVANNYAYIVDENQEAFNVIDVSDVNNLSIVGTLNFGTDPQDVVVSGNYAYVLEARFAIGVVDVSDPMDPTDISFFDGLNGGGGANGIALAGNYLYVVDGSSNDLRIVDISNPLSLSLTGSLTVGDFPTAVAASGDYAYVVDSDSDDLKVINVSNPASPMLIASLPIGDEPTSVAVAGNTVYVVDTNSDDIKAIDVSDPTTPSLKASLPIGTHPNLVVTDEFFAYVVDSDSDDLKSIGACNELLNVDGATGAIQSTPIKEITAIETLVDTDEDTKIQVEESEDEDIIRFDVAGEEK
ncbi:MAG: hypothetical protein AAGI23_23135 [Bacteroidota bacterium]